MSGRNNYSIDSLRAIAIFFVVLLHIDALKPGPDASAPFLLLRDLWRIAVPFFFATSAYFFARRLGNPKPGTRPVRQTLLRLSLIYVVWSLFHLVNLPVITTTLSQTASLHAYYWNLAAHYQRAIAHALADLPHFILTGGTYHLWFIPALMFGLAIVATAIRLQLSRWLLAIAVLIHVADSYFLNFWQENFLVALVSCAIGLQLQQMRDIRTPHAVMLLLTGVAINTYLTLALHITDAQTSIAYGPGTLLMTAGLLMLAFARPNFGKSTWLPTIGTYTLGIYAIHPLFDQYLSDLPYWQGAAGSSALALSIYAASLFFVYALSRIAPIRPMVA